MRNLALALILGLSSNAYALSCIWGVYGANVGESDQVPVNVQFLVQHTFDETADLELELRDEADRPVPVTVQMRYGNALIVPDAELEPGSSYTLVSTGDDGWTSGMFTTGTDADTTAPDAPDLIELRRSYDITQWGDVKGIEATVTEVPDASYYEFELSTEPDFADAARVASVEATAMLGVGLCLSSFPDYKRSERYHVRARAVDLAGNPSPWSTSDGPVTGCSSVGSLGLGLGFPALLLALLRRQRVRSRSTARSVRISSPSSGSSFSSTR